MEMITYRCISCEVEKSFSITAQVFGKDGTKTCLSCNAPMTEITKEQQEAERKAYDAVRAAEVKEARENSILPPWCLRAINYEAYESGHSAGQSECDSIELGLIGAFEAEYKNDQMKPFLGDT